MTKLIYTYRLVASFLPQHPEFNSRPSDVGFMVYEVELGWVFFECFSFPCQCLFHQLFHIR
jgi:hypothetical protein